MKQTFNTKNIYIFEQTKKYHSHCRGDQYLPPLMQLWDILYSNRTYSWAILIIDMDAFLMIWIIFDLNHHDFHLFHCQSQDLAVAEALCNTKWKQKQKSDEFTTSSFSMICRSWDETKSPFLSTLRFVISSCSLTLLDNLLNCWTIQGG